MDPERYYFCNFCQIRFQKCIELRIHDERHHQARKQTRNPADDIIGTLDRDYKGEVPLFVLPQKAENEQPIEARQSPRSPAKGNIDILDRKYEGEQMAHLLSRNKAHKMKSTDASKQTLSSAEDMIGIVDKGYEEEVAGRCVEPQTEEELRCANKLAEMKEDRIIELGQAVKTVQISNHIDSFNVMQEQVEDKAGKSCDPTVSNPVGDSQTSANHFKSRRVRETMEKGCPVCGIENFFSVEEYVAHYKNKDHSDLSLFENPESDEELAVENPTSTGCENSE